MKSKSTEIDGRVSLDECARVFLTRGYYIHEKATESLVMIKPGSSFTVSVKRVPLELRIELTAGKSLVSLKYGTFVLFDTGDLAKELSRVVGLIQSQVEIQA